MSAPSELRLHVAGMDCADEAALIRHALARPGILSLNFDLVGRRVDVAYDADQITQAAILAAVVSTGLMAHSHAAGDHVGDDHAQHHHHHDTAKWWAIASGTALRILLESLPGDTLSRAWRLAIVGAGALQLLGLGLFFVGLWPRIRGSGANPEGR